MFNTTNLLIILLIGLIIYYLSLTTNSDIKEGFRMRKLKIGKIGKSIKSIAKKSVKSVKSIGKKSVKSVKSIGKKPRSKRKKPAGLSLDGFNAAIIQVIAKASDQSLVQATTQAYTSEIKVYFEDVFKTNLKLTDAGAALGEDEFQAKAAEGIKVITDSGIGEFTKWFNTFTTPVDTNISNEVVSEESPMETSSEPQIPVESVESVE
jgi:hypothetical protein